MTNLSSFWIYNNNIEGEIPLELLLLPNLSSISARLNRLEGTIPASLVKEGWNLLPQQDGYNLNIDYSRSNTFINSKEIVKKHLVGNNIIIENGDKTMAIPVRTKNNNLYLYYKRTRTLNLSAFFYTYYLSNDKNAIL